jgi:prepilin-type N-terminal cleavage/methylation domain-containing protein
MIKNRQQLGHARRTPTSGFVQAGFTLIELLVVISIIALVAALLISGLNRASKSAKKAAAQRSAAALAQAVDQFRNEFGFLPPLVHDGVSVSAGDSVYQPSPLDPMASPLDGPIYKPNSASDPDDLRNSFGSLVVWSTGLDYNFFRRRSGTGADEIVLSSGGEWDDDAAWDDRRYSKYSLGYYLTGVLDRDIDGVRGPGNARPIIDGSFLGVGYPVGTTRDRYAPIMDVDRRGVQIERDYVEPKEYPEHLLVDMTPDRDDIFADYEDYQRDALVSLVDSFGNAFRYYRWEQGRFFNGQLVVESTLDLNLPPVLVDPRLLAELMNDSNEPNTVDLTGGDNRLRNASYAIVSAGPDGYFGTEFIGSIAAFLGEDVPSDLEDIALMRLQVWEDNAVEVGN